MTRFKDFQWLATAEVARAMRRRIRIEREDAAQAARIGLFQADVSAPATMPPHEFEAFARFRIRGAIIDEFRATNHGARRGGSPTSLKPWHADPADVQMAQIDGLLPDVVDVNGTAVAVSGAPDPEEMAIDSETERHRLDYLRRKMAKLSARDAAVLRLRLAGELTKAIGKRFNVSEARICQVLAESLQRIAVGPLPPRPRRVRVSRT